MLKLLLFICILIPVGNLFCQQDLDTIFGKTPNLRTQTSKEYIQNINELDLSATHEILTLADAIELGIQKNYNIVEQQIQYSLSELQWKNTYDSFWFPELKIKLNTGPHQILNLKNWDNSASSNSGSLSVGFDQYTLFNWGIDHLHYLNEKNSFERSKENLHENRRNLRHNLIISFLNLIRAQEYLKLKKEYLRQFAFLYRLNKQRAVLKKISKAEYYHSRAVYLKAQHLYNQTLIDTEALEEQMSLDIGNKPGTRYKIGQTINFIPIQGKFTDFKRLTNINNTNILEEQNNVKIKTRNYHIALKENLPLPKFTMNLGAYTHTFSTNSSSSDYLTDASNDGINVQATINATWTLWGENGFLNSRKQKYATIEKDLSLKKLNFEQTSAISLTRKYYKNVLNYQNQIKILESQKLSSEKMHNLLMDSYLKKKVSISYLQDSMDLLHETLTYLIQKKFEHAKAKILLAQNIGIDDLPGKNFEQLATYEARK